MCVCLASICKFVLYVTNAYDFVSYAVIFQLIGMDECLNRINGMIEDVKRKANVAVTQPLMSVVSARK